MAKREFQEWPWTMEGVQGGGRKKMIRWWGHFWPPITFHSCFFPIFCVLVYPCAWPSNSSPIFKIIGITLKFAQWKFKLVYTWSNLLKKIKMSNIVIVIIKIPQQQYIWYNSLQHILLLHLFYILWWFLG